MGIDWYSLWQFYIIVSYIMPVWALLLGIQFPAVSFVHLHPGAAESAESALLLIECVVGASLGYFAIRPRPQELELNALVDQRLLIGLTVVLLASTIAWITAFGGVVEAVASVMAIRFGAVQTTSNMPWFTALTSAAWFTCFLGIVAVIEDGDNMKRVGRRISPILLIVVSAAALVLRGSRGQIGSVVVSVALYLSVVKVLSVKRRRAIMLGLAVFSIAVVTLFKPAMTFLRISILGDGVEAATENFVREVSLGTQSAEGDGALIGRLASELVHFPIMEKLAIEFDRAHPEDRDYGNDLKIAAGKLLPASLYEPDGYPLTYRTTDLMLGTWESQVPPGIVAWFVLSAGMLLVFPGAIMCGLIVAVAERLTIRLLRRTWWKGVGYLGFGMTVTAGIISGTPGDLFRSVVTLAVVIGSGTIIARTVAVFAATRRKGSRHVIEKGASAVLATEASKP